MFSRRGLYTDLDANNPGAILIKNSESDVVVLVLTLAAAEDLADELVHRAEHGRMAVMAKHDEDNNPKPENEEDKDVLPPGRIVRRSRHRGFQPYSRQRPMADEY